MKSWPELQRFRHSTSSGSLLDPLHQQVLFFSSSPALLQRLMRLYWQPSPQIEKYGPKTGLYGGVGAGLGVFATGPSEDFLRICSLSAIASGGEAGGEASGWASAVVFMPGQKGGDGRAAGARAAARLIYGAALEVGRGAGRARGMQGAEDLPHMHIVNLKISFVKMSMSRLRMAAREVQLPINDSRMQSHNYPMA